MRNFINLHWHWNNYICIITNKQLIGSVYFPLWLCAFVVCRSKSWVTVESIVLKSSKHLKNAILFHTSSNCWNVCCTVLQTWSFMPRQIGEQRTIVLIPYPQLLLFNSPTWLSSALYHWTSSPSLAPQDRHETMFQRLGNGQPTFSQVILSLWKYKKSILCHCIQLWKQHAKRNQSFRILTIITP